MRKVLAIAAAGLTALALTTAAAARDSGACDRRCLLATLTAYTEALTDNDVSHLPLAANIRVTTNGVIGDLGKSPAWGPARRLPYRQAFVDPVTGTAVFYGILTTATRPARPDTPAAEGPAHWWFYVARLELAHRRITEVEEIAYERAPGGFGADPSTLTLPDRIFDTVLPVDERSSRAQLLHIADLYFDAVSHKVDYHKVPWHPECQRVELGVFTVNAPATAGSCGGEFEVPSMKWNVMDRRFYIADVERGVVLAVGNFTTPPEYPRNNGSGVMEVFKVQDGMIRHIAAFFKGDGQPHAGWGEGPGS